MTCHENRGFIECRTKGSLTEFKATELICSETAEWERWESCSIGVCCCGAMVVRLIAREGLNENRSFANLKVWQRGLWVGL